MRHSNERDAPSSHIRILYMSHLTNPITNNLIYYNINNTDCNTPYPTGMTAEQNSVKRNCTDKHEIENINNFYH